MDAVGSPRAAVRGHGSDSPTPPDLPSFPSTATWIPSQEYYPLVLDLINSASGHISLASYQLHYDRGDRVSPVNRLFWALNRAAKRGVRVQVIFNRSFRNRRDMDDTKRSARYLAQQGCGARLCPRAHRLHSKIMLFSPNQVIIGSHNWSVRALSANIEASVLVRSEQFYARVQEDFQKLWNRSESLII